jgi:hypothetical protein
MLLIEETRDAAAMLFEQEGLRGEARALKARALKRYERALKDIALN